MTLITPELTSVVAAFLVVVATLWWRRRAAAPRQAPQGVDSSLDTIQAWPPQAVRVMTLGERQAFEVLRRALPGHLVLAQVPLSRFISVPTRNPYQMWLQRAGRLAVDLLVCDFSSRAVAAIEVRTADESSRAAKRHKRLIQVLRAAGVTVFEWNEDDLPSLSAVREMFLNKVQAKDEAPVRIDARGRRVLPVAEISEILADGDNTDYGQLDPVPSAFYDDLDATTQRRAA